MFKRSLDEISIEALDTILELINSNTLYKGEEWKGILTEFKKYKKEYDKLTSDLEKDLYAWDKISDGRHDYWIESEIILLGRFLLM